MSAPRSCARCHNRTAHPDLGLCRSCHERRQKRRGEREGWLFSSRVPIEVVIDRIDDLHNAGLSYRSIATEAGLGERNLRSLRNGSRKWVHQSTATRIFRVAFPRIPHCESVPDGGQISALGTARRLQSLVAIGYTNAAVVKALGYGPECFSMSRIISGRQQFVTASNARAVDVLWRKLQAVPAPKSTPSTRARLRAERKGWLPPMAWDEESIDDPLARPVAAKSQTMRFPEKYAEMRDIGLSDRQIAERMGIKYGSLEDSLRRYDMPVSDELRSLAYEEAA